MKKVIMFSKSIVIVFLAGAVGTSSAYSISSSKSQLRVSSGVSKASASPLFSSRRITNDHVRIHDRVHAATALRASSTAAATSNVSDDSSSPNEGFLAFKTKYGYLNPFAIYYGVVAILLGLPWFVGLTLCQLLYKLTGDRIDKFRRIPTTISQMWGVVLLALCRSRPEVEGREILQNFFKEGRAAMFVANHNSWMDIPFVGTSIGWKNYKMVSKAELGKVPILGKSIRVGGHVMVDRSSRKSQLLTLKSGMQWLKDGIHLVTFPEGTRSKTGRLLPFKNGAFKMAHKVGAPIIPISIVGAGTAHPANWMFPKRASRGICKVILHEPVESEGITEKELAKLVRDAIIEDLPEDQRPLDEYE
mmetsp:Transcript_27480/g.34007  ORF Transcript_27480/g.34007 Transcript_27480/m.34007 type:complete len:361 (+) Transcript_27480:138-1220(+)